MADLNGLKDALSYDAKSGIFTWKVRPSNAVKAGDKAGTVNPLGYVMIGYKGKIYAAHRIAWAFANGEWPSLDIDHINGNPTDNRAINVRLASDSQNLQNRKLCTRNKSGIKGVFWYKASSKWCAQIRKGGKKFYLGYFDRIEDAQKAVIEARNSLHGEFANHGVGL